MELAKITSKGQITIPIEIEKHRPHSHISYEDGVLLPLILIAWTNALH